LPASSTARRRPIAASRRPGGVGWSQRIGGLGKPRRRAYSRTPTRSARTLSPIVAILMLAIFIAVIAAVVAMTQAQRKIPVGREDVEEAAALNDEAFALMQDGRWEDALPLLERAVPALTDTFSDDFRYEAYAEYNLGRTLAELDRCEEAGPHLDRSKQLQGNLPEIREAKKSCRKGKDEEGD